MREIDGDGPTYVSVDVDGLDIDYSPRSYTSDVAGYDSVEEHASGRGLAEQN